MAARNFNSMMKARAAAEQAALQDDSDVFNKLVMTKFVVARRDPLQNVDETVPGFIPDPSTYQYGKPGKRRARTFSQAIAEATGGVDAGMNRFSQAPPDLSSSAYKPDWRGHYDAAQAKPTPRAALQLQTYPQSEIKPLTLAERMKMDKFDRAEQLRRQFMPKSMRR